jgi:hypothetical protein
MEYLVTHSNRYHYEKLIWPIETFLAVLREFLSSKMYSEFDKNGDCTKEYASFPIVVLLLNRLY